MNLTTFQGDAIICELSHKTTVQILNRIFKKRQSKTRNENAFQAWRAICYNIHSFNLQGACHVLSFCELFGLIDFFA